MRRIWLELARAMTLLGLLALASQAQAGQWFVVDVNHHGQCVPSPFGDLSSAYYQLAYVNGWGPCQVTKLAVFYTITCENVPPNLYDTIFMSDDLTSCQAFMAQVNAKAAGR